MPLDGAARAALIALIENSAKQAVLEGSGMPKPPSLASAAETQYVPPTEALLQGTRVHNPVRTVLELRPRAAVTLEGSVSVADAAKRMAAANATYSSLRRRMRLAGLLRPYAFKPEQATGAWSAPATPAEQSAAAAS